MRCGYSTYNPYFLQVLKLSVTRFQPIHSRQVCHIHLLLRIYQYKEILPLSIKHIIEEIPIHGFNIILNGVVDFEKRVSVFEPFC